MTRTSDMFSAALPSDGRQLTEAEVEARLADRTVEPEDQGPCDIASAVAAWLESDDAKGYGRFVLAEKIRRGGLEAMIDLDRLNSATKYPSIPTYHALDERGRIAPGAMPQVDFDGESVIVTEKVDGTNGRLVIMPDGDWFVGSREELLTARGDRIANGAQRIVEALGRIPYQHAFDCRAVVHVIVVYFEAYGRKIGANAKHYVGGGTVGSDLGARVFDVGVVPMDVLEMDVRQIAAWRDGGGQTWATEEGIAEHSGALILRRTPRVGTSTPPIGARETRAWLERFAASQCTLGGGAIGNAEGVVVRTRDRSKIAKIRFDDYRRII